MAPTLRQSAKVILIGLMSGTSCDGIDAALVDISGEFPDLVVTLISAVNLPYPKPFQSALLQLGGGKSTSTSEICMANSALGGKLAQAALEVCKQSGFGINDVDAICSHGHTIWHQPIKVEFGGELARGTLQIGDPTLISEQTGRQVIFDFRNADMAVGGQGAPLVPFADWILFRSPSENRVFQNIGGIANLCWLSAGGYLADIIAFDTGPGNMIIDRTMLEVTNGNETFDRDGLAAKRGTVSEEMLVRLLDEDAYLNAMPPKSTGREYYGEDYFQSRILGLSSRLGVTGDSLVATVTAFTAATIAQSFKRFLPEIPDRVIFGGGGTKNKALMEMLQKRLPATKFSNSDEFGILSEAKEAVSFAILGYETLHHRPSNVPSATGAKKSVILGSIRRP